MDDHLRIAAEKRVGDFHPAQHVQPVEPAHADRPAFAPAVVMQIGQQDVVTQVVIIEVADHQHPHGAVGISVDDDGRAVGRFGSRSVERV